MEQVCSSSELLSDLEPKLVTDFLAQLPCGRFQSRKAGMHHDCRRGKGNQPMFCHCSFPWLISYPILVAAGHTSGWLRAEGRQGWAQAGKIMCESKRHPSIPAGWLLLPWALCEQLSPLSPAGPSLQVQAAVSVPGSSLCPAPVCACLRSPFDQGGGVCLVSQGPCKRHQLQGSLGLGLGVFVKDSTTPVPQQSVFFSVRGKHGGRTEQSFKWQTYRCLYGSGTWETGGISKVKRTIFLHWKEDWALFWRDEKECDKGVVKRCSLLLKIRRGTRGIMRLCSNLKHVTSFPA